MSYVSKKLSEFGGRRLFDLMVLQNLWAVSVSWSRSQIVEIDEIHSNQLDRSLSTNILTIQFKRVFDTERKGITHQYMARNRMNLV